MTNSPSDAPIDLVKRLEAAHEPLDNIAKFDDEYGLLHFSNARLLLNLLREATAALSTIERETIERASARCDIIAESYDKDLLKYDSGSFQIRAEQGGTTSKLCAESIRALSPTAASATEQASGFTEDQRLRARVAFEAFLVLDCRMSMSKNEAQAAFDCRLEEQIAAAPPHSHGETG